MHHLLEHINQYIKVHCLSLAGLNDVSLLLTTWVGNRSKILNCHIKLYNRNISQCIICMLYDCIVLETVNMGDGHVFDFGGIKYLNMNVNILRKKRKEHLICISSDLLPVTVIAQDH